MECDFKWLGLTPIQKTQDLQKELVVHKSSKRSLVLGCEHPEVLSIGRSLWGKELSYSVLKNFSSTFKSDRGGLLTLHNPGQLVIYPVIDYCGMGCSSPRLYIQKLVNFTHQLVSQKIQPLMQGEGSQMGLYTNKGKIASFGFKFSRGWVSNGLAINVCNDLQKFNTFDVCGQTQASVSSYEKEGVEMTPQVLFRKFQEEFLGSF